ncbi:uncharacterized protein B0I36DRAFT_359081 [Microdochium trichocladiopsis]|uniref:Uncharacterized protein n=1 Tax=Microdochium trichocladiopsis TaxID=1682393 RepID=A0A9P8YG83_9PEZI|nr:uncharacterized protein B0I36DRAFT_359081 [Microdochium trichocladiopsis]KAH7037373.1 hypothetical protein B0I36DRAFT_359081 [Microdochium trichocladiopsis]
MVSSRSSKGFCEGAPSWTPAAYISDRALHDRAASLLEGADDVRAATAASFSLPARDSYVYHAHLSVTLAQVQHAVSLGAANHLHAWYRDPADPARPAPPPPRADVDAYLAIFDPATATANALKALASNAKKGSLRARVAQNLQAKRFLHPALLPQLTIPKRKQTAAAAATTPANPYLTFLGWACRNLEWCGPNDLSETAPPTSHPVLPLLMHHFGCVCPTFESLEIIRVLAAGREVIDMGSGSGYWTFMLRQHGLPGGCHPVDNAQSSWRVMWVDDTEIADGEKFLRQKRGGAPDAVLLLVYPIVGGGVAGGEEGGFTRSLLRAYTGDTLVVVGTQNRNGYTGFRSQSMDEYMAREHGSEWTKVVQIPLPSFPGKDEAMFVFQRGQRAPPAVEAEPKPTPSS